MRYPQAPEAESSYLGALMLLRPPKAKYAVEECDDAWFFTETNAMLFRVLRSLALMTGSCDMVQAQTALKERGKLEELGGADRLIRIQQDCPSPANWQNYAEMIRDAYERRELIDRATRVVNAAASEQDLEEVKDLASEIVHGIGARAVVQRVCDIDPIGNEGGIMSGFECLDECTDCRGYPNGQVVLICAETNSGKTAFMLSSLLEIAKREKSVLYATFADLDKHQVKRRLLRALSCWSKRPDDSNPQGQALFDDAMSKFIDPAIGGLDIEILDAVDLEDSFDVEAFCSWLTRRQLEKPYDAVFVDYCQELTSRDRKAETMTATAQICSARIARLAKRLRIPIICGSQISTNDGKTMAMYSRGWNQKAGLELLIADDMKTIKVKKNRFGPRDQVLPISFDSTRVRFREDF